MSKCLSCDGDLSPEKELSCDLCKKYIHSTSTSMSRAEIQCLKAKDRCVTFHCIGCKTRLSKLDDLWKTVNWLEAEVRALKSGSSVSLGHDDHGVQSEPKDQPVSRIVDELQDRQARESNLIVFNVKETALDDRDGGNAAVRNDLVEIFHSIDDTVDLSSMKFVRLGRYSPDRTRPVKVTLSCKSDALNILRNKKKNKTPIRIRADLTDVQRRELVELRSELARLNESGLNKTIRYIHGGPQIVDLKN